jgi:DNA-binding response OmpR family regulator
MNPHSGPRSVALLVDEDAQEGHAHAVVEGVARCGLTCVSFSECSQAFRYLEENPAPAVIVVDLGLVGRGAVTLCDEIRRAPRLRQTPLVLTVRGRVAADDGIALTYGATLLSKPCTPSRVAALVAPMLKRHAAGRRWFGRPRMLIADDDDGVLEALAGLAHDEGWDPLCAMDGDRAVDIATASTPPPQLAVIDWIMPGKDGVNVASTIASTRGHAFPIVIMSGHDGIDEALRVLHGTAAITHLRKPFPRDEIVSVMQRVAGTALRGVAP